MYCTCTRVPVVAHPNLTTPIQCSRTGSHLRVPLRMLHSISTLASNRQPKTPKVPDRSKRERNVQPQFIGLVFGTHKHGRRTLGDKGTKETLFTLRSTNIPTALTTGATSLEYVWLIHLDMLFHNTPLVPRGSMIELNRVWINWTEKEVPKRIVLNASHQVRHEHTIVWLACFSLAWF